MTLLIVLLVLGAYAVVLFVVAVVMARWSRPRDAERDHLP